MDALATFSAVFLVVAAVAVQNDSSGASSQFVGAWSLNLSESKLHPSDRTQRRTLEFAVSGDAVDMKDIMVDAAGQSSDLSQRFVIDGAERPHPAGPGFVLVARRLAPTTIEVTSKKDGQVFATVRYAVSSDGRSLASTVIDATGAETQVLVFDRR